MGEHGNTITVKCNKCKAMVPWGAEKCPGCGTALRSENKKINIYESYNSREINDKDPNKEKIRRSTLFVLFYVILIIACIVFWLTQKN
jgi:ribosomal protein L40E